MENLHTDGTEIVGLSLEERLRAASAELLDKKGPLNPHGMEDDLLPEMVQAALRRSGDLYLRNLSAFPPEDRSPTEQHLITILNRIFNPET